MTFRNTETEDAAPLPDNGMEAERTLRTLFEKAPVGIACHEMVYDALGKPVDYRFLDANERYRELTGCDPRGRTATQVFPGIEQDPFDWIGTFGHVARTGESARFEQALKSTGRRYECVAYRYRPDHFVAVFLEITGRGRAEEERKGGLETRTRQAQKRETVLLVEDEPAILKMTARILESQGYTVYAADTPAEAIRLAGEHASECHLLLTDVIMPEMNGCELAKKLLSLHPHLKCLFMSGYTAQVIFSPGMMKEGAHVHFVQKPFTINELANKVRESLDAK